LSVSSPDFDEIPKRRREAMRLDLLFVGQICHASLSGREVAVVPTGPIAPAPEHLFRILVPKNKVDGSTTAPYDQAFARSDGTENSYKSLTGNITMSGLSTSSTRTVSPAFDEQVPHLQQVSNHVILNPAVVNSTPGGTVRVLISHPPGAMDVVKSFMEMASFYPVTPGWPNPRCIAAISSVLLETANPLVTITDGTMKVVLAADVGTIVFLNMPLDFAHEHGDFSLNYRALFADNATESLPVAAGTCQSGWKINTVECSNTQYP
jgi:hypothetical protein